MIDAQVLEQISGALEESPDAIYRTIGAHVAERQECEPTAESTPMETLGSLTDKLMTVSQKMWHNQERLYEIRRMTLEEFHERWDGELDELHEVIKRCCDLNVQRSSLMDEIDTLLHDVASGEKKPEALVREAHKSY